VEYCYLHPVTFDEFLAAQCETEALRYIVSVKQDTAISKEIHAMLQKKFNTYLLVGGMPEAVAHYAESRSFIDVDPVYKSILTGLRDDVSKYASDAKAKYIQHIIEHASKYAGLPVKYEKFGESNFRSREMSEAFNVLEKAMLINRVFASTSKQISLSPFISYSEFRIFYKAWTWMQQGQKSAMDYTDFESLVNDAFGLKQSAPESKRQRLNCKVGGLHGAY
jgi:uncharacterized protein